MKKGNILQCRCCEEKFIAIPEDAIKKNTATRTLEVYGTDKVEFFYCDKCLANGCKKELK